MKVILYSTGCSRCSILKSKLDSEGIDYELCNDVDKMKSLGILSVPVLQVGDKIYSFQEAIYQIPAIKHELQGGNNK